MLLRSTRKIEKKEENPSEDKNESSEESVYNEESEDGESVYRESEDEESEDEESEDRENKDSYKYIVYFEVRRFEEKFIPSISIYKFCGAYNHDNLDIKRLELVYDDFKRKPNAKIIQKDDDDYVHPNSLIAAIVSLKNRGSHQIMLTNENKIGLPVYALYIPHLNVLRIFNFDFSQLE